MNNYVKVITDESIRYTLRQILFVEKVWTKGYWIKEQITKEQLTHI
jgi:hypothetical protein